MNYTVIIAARMGSTRLPGKAILPVGGIPMLVFLIRRLKNSRLANRIILATTNRSLDNVLESWAKVEGIDVFRGSQDDVMARFVGAAEWAGGDYVVRVTADCPLVDGKLLDYCLEYCGSHLPFDLATTKKAFSAFDSSFPVGLDFEIYRSATMSEIHSSRLPSPEDREHLTSYIYKHPADYRIISIKPPAWLPDSDYEFTIDSAEDYNFLKRMVSQGEGVDTEINEIIQHANSLTKSSKVLSRTFTKIS